MMALIALALLPAAAIAIDPALIPAAWQSGRIDRLKPSQIADEIAAADPMSLGLLAKQGVTVHLARLIDDRPLVIVDNLPRRLCPATALLLAQQGDLSIFDRAMPDRLASSASSLCHQREGDAHLTWSPAKLNH